MLDKKYFKKIRLSLLSYRDKRRDIIKVSGDALYASKKAIFALQRDDLKNAEDYLQKALELLLSLQKNNKNEDEIITEGSFRASLEEYAEASIFHMFVVGKEISELDKIKIDGDTYVGGVCDTVGEIYRYAIKSATEKKFTEVERCFTTATAIISELVDMDLTGYNRQKFDQAKQALNKIQEIRYEVSIRNLNK